MYTSSDDADDGYYDNFIDFIDEAVPEPTASSYDADDGYYGATGWGRGRWHPPKFFSHPNGTLFRVLSRKNYQTILEPSPDNTLIQLSEDFTKDIQEQALLQGPKARVFLSSLLKLWAYADELDPYRYVITNGAVQSVLRDPTNLPVTSSASEGLIESSPEPPTYKHQEHYLCFDHDFDTEEDEAADLWLRLRHESSLRESPLYTQASSLPSITHTTTPTTAAADLLLTLINQVPATSPPSPLSPFNFSYIDVTPPQTTPSPSDDSDIVPSKLISCDKYSTATLSTTSLERTTSYSLLSSHLLVPSQFIKLSYGDKKYCTVLTSKQTPATLPSSIPKTVTETFIPSLRDKPTRSVSPDDVSDHPYSRLRSVDVGLMMITIMIILSTILITILTILPMMLLLLPAVILTHEEQAISPNTNTVITTTILMTTPSDASSAPTFSHDPGKRKELRLQRQQFWAFIQKLHYSRIGSSCSGFQWITAILYKLSMTIWTLWQFHNDGARSSSSAWQLLLGVLH